MNCRKGGSAGGSWRRKAIRPAILRDIAIAAARRLAQEPFRRRKSGGFLGALLDGNPLGRLVVFHLARKQVLAQTRGNYPAPLAALEAVRHGLSHGVKEGLKRESQLFGQLALSDVSRKLVQTQRRTYSQENQ